MSQILTYVSNSMRRDATGALNNLVDIRFSYIMDGQVIAGVGTGALELEAELSKLPATYLSDDAEANTRHPLKGSAIAALSDACCGSISG